MPDCTARQQPLLRRCAESVPVGCRQQKWPSFQECHQGRQPRPNRWNSWRPAIKAGAWSTNHLPMSARHWSAAQSGAHLLQVGALAINGSSSILGPACRRRPVVCTAALPAECALQAAHRLLRQVAAAAENGRRRRTGGDRCAAMRLLPCSREARCEQDPSRRLPPPPRRNWAQTRSAEPLGCRALERRRRALMQMRDQCR